MYVPSVYIHVDTQFMLIHLINKGMATFKCTHSFTLQSMYRFCRTFYLNAIFYHIKSTLDGSLSIYPVAPQNT